MKQYVNHHQHGIYSFLDGAARYEPLLERAHEMGMPALGITEHGNVHGWLDFYRTAKKIGIKPELGMEGYQARKTRFDRDEEERSGKAADDLDQRGPYHLTLIARNMEGYRNLMKLSSQAYLEGFYVKPRLDYELLEKHSSGVTILSGCLAGEVCQALLRNDVEYATKAAERMQSIVGRDHYFIEIMNHGLPEQTRVNRHLVDIARKLNAPLVPTGDCHYVHKEEATAHDVMLCVSTGATLDQDPRFKFYNDQFYLKSYEEMAQVFPEDWLANTLTVSEQVELELSFGTLYFPKFPLLPEGETVDSYLATLVREGLHHRYGEPLPQNVRDRANYEFATVKSMGFQSYFLVVWDLVRYAREQGIRVGFGRGSAAGSILSYALGITGLDPLKFDLLFERFLVEGRTAMPDIDLDFDDRYRDRVINYARETYGDDRVARICTFSGMKARSAIRDAARVLGLTYAEGDRVAKLVPPPVLGVTKSFDDCMEQADFKKAYNTNQQARQIIDTARPLEGLLRQPGIHAAGVVISQSETTNFVPVMQKPLKGGGAGPIVTQWEMEDVEACGLLKIDFLGLRNLSVVDTAVSMLMEELDIDMVPLDDNLTYDMLCAGHTIGSFQLESEGIRQMTVELQPRSIEDIMALIALYRPGPMGSGMDKSFLARRQGKQDVKVAHPKLKEVLKDTYGIMLYQEDVLAVTRQLAGFSVAEAEDLRKAIGKKLMDKIPIYRRAFVDGCRKTNNVPEGIANKIYSEIEYFGGYGFGKAHAASYAMLSYVTTYLKVHHPTAYMAALLSSVEGDRLARYLHECRRLNIEVRPPSINNSHRDFSLMGEQKILFGLQSIKGIGGAIADVVLKDRENDYTSIHDFMRRCDPEVLNKATLEHLIRSGACDELIAEDIAGTLSRDDRMEILDLERAELGIFLTDHPLLGIEHLFASQTTHEIAQLEAASVGSTVKLGGLLSEVAPMQTKKGDLMYKLRLEDLTGSIEVIVFPRDANRVGDRLEESSIVIIEGRLQHEGDDEHVIPKLILSDVSKLKIPTRNLGEPIVLRFTDGLNRSIIERVKKIVEDNPGDSYVYFEVPEGDNIITLQLQKPTSIDMKDVLESLIALDGANA